tara:strand:+ start:68 stop:496 length:429 start_codon:yes stop_codon:yes gene_type:complete
MTLVKARAAFEKAITDAVTDVDPTVKMIYDNIVYTTPGKTVKYIVLGVNFGQAIMQNQGASSDYYSGFVQCNVYVPKNKGTSVLAAISESVIDGMTSVNASDYADTYSCKPKTTDVVGPGIFDTEDESHCMAVITCQFSANA